MLPNTSLEANKAASLEMRSRHWERIKEALKELTLATGEQIAAEAKMDYHAVMRRLSEMERLEMVYKPGGKLPTSTGRLAYQYALRNSDTVLPVPEKFNPDEPHVADYANLLIAKSENLKKEKDLIIDNRLPQLELFQNQQL